MEPVRTSWHPCAWTGTHVGLLLLSHGVHDGVDLQEQLTDLHHETKYAPGQESEKLGEVFQKGLDRPIC